MKLFILCLCFTLSLCGKNYHENEIWGKPCIDDDSLPSSFKSTEEVIRYSGWIIEQLGSYKDEFIRKLEKHHMTFNELVQFTEYEKKEWLRKFYWFIEEILPNNKLLGIPLPANSIEELKAKIKLKSVVMTKINLALKFILGTFHEITKLDVYAEIMNVDLNFRRTMRESIRIIKSITCSMDNYMKSKNYQIEILLGEILPKNMTHSEVGFMLRDTFNYFEYIKQLFEALRPDENIETVLPNEPELWANPCHYSTPKSYYINKSSVQNDWNPDPDKSKKLAIKIMKQAKKTLEDGLEFGDEYAQLLFNSPTFNQSLQDTSKEEWLRKLSWYRDEVLPESKQLYSEIGFNYISKRLIKVLPKVLPLMHKGAKVILSGLNRIVNLEVYKKIPHPYFREKVEEYLKEVQRFLCLFSDFVRARGQEQLWLFEETRFSPRWVFTIYRDSLNYLSYIAEVFEHIVRLQATCLDPYAAYYD